MDIYTSQYWQKYQKSFKYKQKIVYIIESILLVVGLIIVMAIAGITYPY